VSSRRDRSSEKPTKESRLQVCFQSDYWPYSGHQRTSRAQQSAKPVVQLASSPGKTGMQQVARRAISLCQGEGPVYVGVTDPTSLTW
jgi:hypothetical protein